MRLSSRSGIFAGGIAPLLWHHGEPTERIAEEIAAIRSSDVHEFILEPRPHPDYLGPRWWRDAGFVVEEARRLGMRVWFFDDGRFPSGWAGGRVPERYPDLGKRFLALRRIDVRGPVPGASFRVRAWLEAGDDLVAVVLARRDPVTGRVAADSLVDLSRAIHDGVLYRDLPEGSWRVCIVVQTRSGGERETGDYVNPVDRRAAAAVISLVHEPHLRHLGAEFGRTIRGFFQDEPRFGNTPSYDHSLGASMLEYPYGAPDHAIGGHEAVLPWAPGMLAELTDALGEPAGRLLPLLWIDAEEEEHTARCRYAFMDVASGRFAGYLGELGDWCRDHGLKLIGHLIEDNGAHARLGFGPGHYFRAIGSQDAAGIDVVHQIHPGATSGRSASPFGVLDDGFFYWGLAKLASSAAHLQPRLGGRALSEAFGAYGWHLGVRGMVWLTDHLAVRGINAFVPHAFSPRPDDPDCPPHFHDAGSNPQWQHFQHWVDYARTVTGHLAGRHHADAAVLYHAEAEWAGVAQPFEVPLARLAERQLDADVVPVDVLVAAASSGDGAVLRIADEEYPVLVLPAARRWPASLLEALVRLLDRGVPVLVTGAPPIGSSTSPVAPEVIERLSGGIESVAPEALADSVLRLVRPSVEVDGREPDLRCLHVSLDGDHRYFFTDESVVRPVAAEVWIRDHAGSPVLLDPATGEEYGPDARRSGSTLVIRLELEPGGSRILSFGPRPAPPRRRLAVAGVLPSRGWSVSAEGAGLEGSTLPSGPGAITRPGVMPSFAGTLWYARTIALPPLSPAAQLDLGEVGEIASVRLNGVRLGTRFRRPYRFPLAAAARPGHNELEIEVVTTAAPARGDNPFDRAAAIAPAGLLGPVLLMDVEAALPESVDDDWMRV